MELEDYLGLLKFRVKKGLNLAVRDASSSDPYAIITMGNRRLKTRVVKDNCNPEWNDELTLSVKEPIVPIHLAVYDKDTFSGDDRMGDADINLEPYLDAIKLSKSLERLPEGCALKKIQPDRDNCLADESRIVWQNGKIVQDIELRLRNVECGEVSVQLEWLEVPGCKGLGGDPF